MIVNIELIIQHKDKVFMPAVEEGIVWSTERKNSPGQLTFTVIKDSAGDFTEGDPVRLKVNGDNIFYGWVFKKQVDKEQRAKVTAYDQLRYLKNKDTYVYENKTAGELIKIIAEDFKMQVGDIEDTGFKIAERAESNKTLFDIIQNALDLTVHNKKHMYVLYDDFGKLCLKSIDKMKTDVLIDRDTAENYDYVSSIDSDTYNRIKLIYDNEETKKRDVYVSQSSENIKAWGVLQYHDTIEKGENGQAKADSLLALYNQKTKSLSIRNALGSNKIRAGSMVVVMLSLGDEKISNFMLVEKCKHEYRESQHLMDLHLIGGAFNAG